MIVRGHSLLAAILLYAGIAGICRAYPTRILSFEELAKAPVIATCIVQETSRDPNPTPPSSGNRVISAHATLLVLRTFPELIVGARASERIQLDYEALPKGDLGMNGPDVPNLSRGVTLVLPLKINPKPSSGAWRLIADEGGALVIPAIPRKPPFSQSPRNGREFLLYEIASVLISGTRTEVFAEVSYVSGQKTIASELTQLLEPKLGADEDRWALIAASLLSSMGVPRATITELRSGKDTVAGDFSGSFITALLQRLGESARARELLIHGLLINSDIAAWGAGITLREFAQDPSLIRELRAMLQLRRAGSLSVARDILSAGQKEIFGDATSLALHYISTPGTSPSELQPACWVIRDFGTDEQFSRFISEIRKSQYRDRHHYDELWRNTIWSDSKRERAVLEILLADQRIFTGNQRYSDIARYELARIQTGKR